MPVYYSPTDSRNYRLELEIVESSQDITNNTTTISYWLFLRALGSFFFQDFASTISLVIDGVSILNTTTQRVSLPSANSATLLTSGTRVINHNADGTKSIAVSASFRTNSTTSFTPIPTHIINNSMVLTTIPRASQPTLNVSTQALGSAITISTNRASTAFTHILKYTFGSEQGTIATGVGDSTSWTLPNSLANAIPNSQSGSGSITCETYNGSTLIGVRTVTFTATVPNNATFQPNASISSITEGQSGLTIFSVFIQNISRLRVQSTASGNFGATISQRRVTIDGGHLFGADVTFNPINKSGSITVTLLVTDSRGYSRTVTQNVTLVEYFAPRINSFSASRSPNDQGTDLAAPVNFDIAPISNQNGKYYRVRYRVSGGSWVLLFESGEHYSRVFTHTATGILNANNSYEIELYVADWFTSATKTVTVGTAFDLLNFNQSGKGMAIGKVSENANGLEIALPTNFTSAPTVNGTPIGSPSLLAPFPVGAIYMSVVSTSPQTLFGGTWTALQNQFLVASGATFPAGSTGGATVHNHTVPDHTHTVPAHTHSTPAHSHGAGGLFAKLAFWSTTSIIMERVTGVASWADNLFKTIAGDTGSSPGANTVGVGVGGSTASGGASTTGSGGSGATGSAGGANTGNGSSLPPYLSVYMWRRTA